MKKIEKLTPEQEAMMPICRDKLIAQGLRTGETDWETAETNIKLAYQKAGLQIPTKIIRVQSPLIGALAASISDRILNNIPFIVNHLQNKKINNIYTTNNSDAVDSAVDNAVRSAVSSAVGSAVGDAVRSAVDNAVDNAVGSAVKKLIIQSKLQWHYWLGGQFWIGGWYWGTAFSEFLINYCDLEVSKDIFEKFNIYKNINFSCNYIWCNKDFIMICARPIKINRNNEGQLHSITEKSIEYPDGWGLYSIRGITISENIFIKLTENKYSFEDFTKEENEEIKSAVIAFLQEKYGEEYIFRFLSSYLKEIDTYVDKKDEKYLKGTTQGINVGVYTLYQGEVNGIKIAYVRCYCPSTDRMFFLGVSSEFTNAKDAIASLFRVPIKLKNNIKYIQRQGEKFSITFDNKGLFLLKSLSKEDIQNVTHIDGNTYFNLMKYEY